MAYWDPTLWKLFDVRFWIDVRDPSVWSIRLFLHVSHIRSQIPESTCKSRRFRTKRVTDAYFRDCIWPNYTAYRQLVFSSQRSRCRLCVACEPLVLCPHGTAGDAIGVCSLAGGEQAAAAESVAVAKEQTMPDLYVLDGELAADTIEQHALAVLVQLGVGR
jgi:hypothetical protein